MSADGADTCTGDNSIDFTTIMHPIVTKLASEFINMAKKKKKNT